MSTRSVGFVAGTRVLTESAPRAIEGLAVGEHVTSTKVSWRKRLPPRPVTEPMKVRPSRVAATTRATIDEVVDLGWLSCAVQQPLLIADRGWVPAGSVIGGMSLVSRTGLLPIERVSRRAGRFEVHRIEVEHHVHHAGDRDVVVLTREEEAPPRATALGCSTNQRMDRWLAESEILTNVRVPSKIAATIHAGARQVGDLWMLSERAKHTIIRDDETGAECRTNDIWLRAELDDDMAAEAPALAATALACAKHLATALEATGGGPFRIIASVRDDGTGTLRFHKRREGQAWISDNLEGFLEEGMLVMDTV